MTKIFYLTVCAFIFAIIYMYSSLPLTSGLSKRAEFYVQGNGSNAQIVNVENLTELQKYSFSKVHGEGAIVEDKQKLFKFITDYGVEFYYSQKIEDGTSYYGYSNKIRYSQKLNGKIINVHIHVKNGTIKIGFPIIFGSY